MTDPETKRVAEEILLARVRAWKGFRDEAEEIVPILARLVREGQARELESLVAMRGGVPWSYIHARIAALRQEG